MSNEETNPTESSSSSPAKRTINGDSESRPSKRHKVEQSERPVTSRELAPRPPHLQVKTTTASHPRPPPQKTIIPPGSKRATFLNLKNYPSNHHPVGIAIWILQKVEQARRELDVQRIVSPTNYTSSHTSPIQSPAGTSASASASATPWLGPVLAIQINVPPAREQEAERLQAQRNRKTKQRQENWVKNKETDIVARAKIEAKKHFEAFAQATDADQQKWIEEKVRLDFGRLLDRLAAQLNCDVVGISPFQIGFADYFFNRANNSQLESIDNDTILAARLIAYVLPALTESAISPRHQYAADTLVYALNNNSPSQEAFFAAIQMLAQESQVLAGLDKLMANLFTPKTGPQLARKRGSGLDQSTNSSSGASPPSATPTTTVWHWKEPATIANSSRFSPSSLKATVAPKGATPEAIVQPYYQESLPPPILVHAEIFRPPIPAPMYYQYPVQQPLQQAYMRPHPPQPMPAPAALITDFTPDNEIPVNAQALSGFTTQTANKDGQSRNSASPPPISPSPTDPNGKNECNTGHPPPILATTALMSALTPAEAHDVSVEKAKSPNFKEAQSAQQENTASVTPQAATTAASPVTGESMRRRSLRGTVLTSKAKAAGILLGTKTRAQDEENSSKPSEFSNAHEPSTSTEADPGQSQNAESIKFTVPQETSPGKPPTATSMNDIQAKTPHPDASNVADFVPRSSGRERKPTAKLLALSDVNSGIKSKEYSSSVPQVSSKLRLSISSQSSLESETSVFQPETSLSPGAETQTSPDSDRVKTAPGQKSKSAASKPCVAQISKLDQIEGPGSQMISADATNAENSKLGEDVDDIIFTTTKFLTNQKGQSMSQALLQMAEVAAEWSDSDDDDDDEGESEQAFQVKLREVVLKKESKRKPLPATRNGAVASSLDARSTKPQLCNGNGEDWHNSAAAVQPTNNRLYSVPDGNTEPFSGPTRPKKGDNSYPRHIYSPQNPVTYPATDPRSTSQITDDWISVVKLKEEAKSRGLTVIDSMSLDQLTNLLKAHDAGDIGVANKSSLKTLAPSPAQPTAISRPAIDQNRLTNGYIDGPHYVPSPGISPSQFYSPRPQAGPSHATSSPASMGPGVAYSTHPRHSQRNAPNGYTHAQHQGTQSLSGPQSTGLLTPSPLSAAISRISTAPSASRYQFNPQGLNGGPPGGGTIINGPESRIVHAKNRQKSKGPDEVNADGRRSATPLSSTSASSTPQPQPQVQPQMPNFKRGGILVSFGKKILRPAPAKA